MRHSEKLKKICTVGVSLNGTEDIFRNIKAKNFLKMIKAQVTDSRCSKNPEQNKYKENYTFECEYLNC